MNLCMAIWIGNGKGHDGTLISRNMVGSILSQHEPILYIELE